MGKHTVEEIAHTLVANLFPANDLINLCFHKDAQVSFHAVWILEKMSTAHFDYFIESFPYFIKRLPETDNPSVKRHFGKIAVYSLHKIQKPIYKKSSQVFWGHKQDALIHALFEWLIDPTLRPVAKVWCIEALDLLSSAYPWISEELPPTVQSLLTDAPPSLQVRGKRLLKKIN